jgi:arylsulfatase
VKFDASDKNGVLVAQGGSAHGYSLFLNDGKITFALRQSGTLTTISSAAPDVGPHTASAILDASGAMALTLDGKRVAQGQAPGLLTTMPRDGLDVGADEGGAVGPYSAPNRFAGTIESVTVELDAAEP